MALHSVVSLIWASLASLIISLVFVSLLSTLYSAFFPPLFVPLLSAVRNWWWQFFLGGWVSGWVGRSIWRHDERCPVWSNQLKQIEKIFRFPLHFAVDFVFDVITVIHFRATGPQIWSISWHWERKGGVNFIHYANEGGPKQSHGPN